MKNLIGIHINNLSEVDDNPHINFFQLFVDPLQDYSKLAKKYKDVTFVVHSSYTINLSKIWQPYDWHVTTIINSITACEQLGAIGIVIHTGKQLELTSAEAINNMYSLLLHVHRETVNSPVKIFLETPSGQGTETLTKIEDFCMFMNKFYRSPNKSIAERFFCCVDTCHVFAAGYNISDKTSMTDFFTVIEKTIGLDKIKLCHINDSKGVLGDKLDRHQNIGLGYIGKQGILQVVELMNKHCVPMILETPGVKILDDYKLISS